jgi:hypothetical protein
VTTNDREYYERQLSYCHLHRSGVTDELSRPPYDGLDNEVLGRKWRAHPLALALAEIQLESLPDRVEQPIAFRGARVDWRADVPGVRPVWPHDKSSADGLYGGLRVVYEPNALGDGDLSVDRYLDALQAEGAPVSGPSVGHLEHLRTISTEGYDLWGNDRGPLGGEFCGLSPFSTYSRGDFPVTEALDERVLRLPSYIEPATGTSEQLAGCFEKVAERAAEL